MKAWLRSEDGWAVVQALVIVVLGLAAAVGADLLGWAVETKMWTDPSKALSAKSKYWTSMGLDGIGSLLATFGFLVLLLGMGAWQIGFPLLRFLAAFTVMFGLSFTCWILGHHATIAAAPDKQATFGISWSLGLTGEAGYLLALLAGLAIANLLPRLARWLEVAAKPEWFIKTAIVVLGAALGLKAAESSGLTQVILFRGLAAILEAYLIYWALVYLVARRVFGFKREWAAPLASGISICGVSAAITTGAAIRARPVVPVMVSSLVVVFAVIEMLILPWAAKTFLSDQPMVAAAWMGLAVKTDGAAISSGAITEALLLEQARAQGVVYEPGFLLMTTTTVKVAIDLFIGVWAIVLACVWTYGIERQPGAKVPWADIWQRFPKFVFAYVLTFGLLFAVGMIWPTTLPTLKGSTDAMDVFRRLFFVMTFFSIGLASDFRKLWAEGLGRLALVYVVCLFGFVVWIGLAISWIFFAGLQPPRISG